ncbi:MAG: hypothetical protein H7Z37_18035 [Pyrinomonadaceae bacterium]|nr:hypothetical protein [Pyrinomonadaceae bacterium]
MTSELELIISEIEKLSYLEQLKIIQHTVGLLIKKAEAETENNILVNQDEKKE